VTAAFLQVAAAACMWGTWSLFLRPSGIPAWASAPVLFAVTGVVLLPLARREPKPRWDQITLGLLFANAGLDALNVVTFFAAMDATTVAIAVLSHYLAPLVVALLAPIIDRERTPGGVAAAAVATIGLALVLRPWEATRADLFGVILGTVSAFAYGANVLVVRHLAVRIGAARAVSYHALLAAVAILPWAELGAIREAGPRALWLVAGALGPGALAGWLFVRALPTVGATRGAVLAFLEPLVAVGIGWAVWDERLGAWAIAGAALVLGAGLWVTRAPAHARSSIP